MEGGFLPNVFNEIYDFLELKLKAVEAYQSQLKYFPDVRSIEALKSLAIVRGAISGMRAAEAADFPHEIGVFLGYPLEDVVGFIRHRGKCFTCCGCWKSYGDPAAAQQHFDQLAKCTAVYLRLFHSGTPILKLAVAA